MQADLDNALTIDTGAGLIRAASNDPVIIDWLRAVFAGHAVAPDDPRSKSDSVEMIVANIGAPAKHRRTRHRLLDHFGTLWYATFERDEAADALAQAVSDRIAAAAGGTWLALPVLVPSSAAHPHHAALLHPWLGRSLDRLLPLLRRSGVAVHPSPQVRYDTETGTLHIDPVARFPETEVKAGVGSRRSEPVALVGVWDDPGTAEIVERFALVTTVTNQINLEAMAELADHVPYARLDSTAGLRSTVAQLTALVLPSEQAR